MKFTLIIVALFVIINSCFAQLLISEILFNPKSGGVDFVEVYNTSGQSVDLSHYYMGNVNNSGQISSLQRLTTHIIYITSASYKVFTTDPTLIIQHYPAAVVPNIIKIPRLPSYPNTQGHVVLLTQKTGIDGRNEWYTVDSLFYTEKMHTPFIKNPKGISLERYSFTEPTNAPGNFRSAAVYTGGATPGFENSSNHHSGASYLMNSKIISPGIQGGFEQLEIFYELERTGLMASFAIYDKMGVLVKRIIRNMSIPSQGVWIWDGLDEANRLSPVGIYTAYIELYDASGYRQVLRKSFVLTY